MRNFKIYASVLVGFFLLLIACTKEISIDAISFFKVEIDKENPISIKLNEEGEIILSIKEAGDLKPEDYKIKYEQTEGEGTLNIGDKIVPKNEFITLSSFVNEIKYIGTTEGKHQIVFSVVNNDDRTIKKTVVFSIPKVAFSFDVTPMPKSAYVGGIIDLQMKIEDVPNDATYKTKYSVLSATDGTKPTQQVFGEVLVDGKVIAPNTNVTTLKGDFKWQFKGLKLGTVKLEFITLSSVGLERKREITINITQTPDFKFTAKADKETVDVNGKVEITFDLKETVGSSVYTMDYLPSNLSTLEYDGIKYVFNGTQKKPFSFPIKAGTSKAVFSNFPLGKQTLNFSINNAIPTPKTVTKKATVSVVIKNDTSDILATGITVTSVRNSIKSNEKEQFTAAVLPANATNKSVTWSSSNLSVATIDAATGLVSAVSVGTTVIKATAKDGSEVSGSKTLAVTALPISTTKITVISDKNSIKVGDKEQFAVAVLPANATNKSVTWRSSKPSVATVNATTGLVSAVSAGATTIKATAKDGSGVSGSKTLTVTAIQVKVTRITVNSVRNSIRTNETERFTAVVLPANATNKSVTWSSSNPLVATVNATTGLVRAGSTTGSTKIIATAKDGSGVSSTKRLAVNFFTTDSDGCICPNNQLICDKNQRICP